MEDVMVVESIRLPNPIEQKVRDAFKDYPVATQRGIVFVLEQQRRNWQRLRSSPHDMVVQVAIETGNAYTPSIPSTEIPKRALSAEEAQEHQAFLASLEPYNLLTTYGTTFNGSPNTRFYLSLKDSAGAIGVKSGLTQRLIDLQKSGTIPFFQYKFDSFDRNHQLRFDPAYRDKGASPILYVSDKDVDLIQQLLDGLAQQYPNAFLAQMAPFKYSPHNKEFDEWHISMEASSLGNTGTPEQGMKKAVSQFLVGLGLTINWTPVQSLDVLHMRDSWKQATASVHRQPKQPWTTTDRTAPKLLTK